MTRSQAKQLGARFKVHIGYTRKGNDRWAYYETLDKARAAVNDVLCATGIMLTILDVDHE